MAVLLTAALSTSRAAASTPVQALSLGETPGVLVKTKPGVGRITRQFTVDGVTLTPGRETGHGWQVLNFDRSLSTESAARVRASVARDSRVASSAVNHKVRATQDWVPPVWPEDPMFQQQYWAHSPFDSDAEVGSYGVWLERAWSVTRGASPVVAVLDTGITAHEDLTNVLPGYDFVTEVEQAPYGDGDGRDADPTDPHAECGAWHGTHVAGIIAAAHNDKGIAGVLNDARLLPVRVLGCGGGTIADVIDGMLWASGVAVPGAPQNTNPAKVLNLSLGASGVCEAPTQQAIDTVTARGTIVVVAAGNEGADVAEADPANCENVVSVAASDREGALANFSNWGDVTLAAPGVNVLSTYNASSGAPGASSYEEMSGTSMAAPVVAGAVAMYLAKNPTAKFVQVDAALRASAQPMSGVGAPYQDCSEPYPCGAGILNVAALMGLVPGDDIPAYRAGAPTAVSAESRLGGVELRWGAPRAYPERVMKYKITVDVHNAGDVVMSTTFYENASRRSKLLTDLPNGAVVYADVTSLSGDGNSKPNRYVSVRSLVGDPPGVRMRSLTADGTSMRVAWYAPAGPTAGGVSRVVVLYVKTDEMGMVEPQKVVVSPSTTTALIEGLSAETEYAVKVIFETEWYLAKESNWSSVFTDTAPPATTVPPTLPPTTVPPTLTTVPTTTAPPVVAPTTTQPSAASRPVTLRIGRVTSVSRTASGARVTWRSLTPKVCRLEGRPTSARQWVRGIAPGECRLRARATSTKRNAPRDVVLVVG